MIEVEFTEIGKYHIPIENNLDRVKRLVSEYNDFEYEMATPTNILSMR